ncbi:MAG TPA: DNA starvation/stationary phase protection protein Dps [Roseomonas sp.]
MAKKSDEPKLMQTHNDVADNAKKVSIGVLQACLNDAIDLTNATRQAHWNVKGPHFSALHALFENFYNQLFEGADEIAERIVQLGGVAYGTTQAVGAGTRLEAYPTELLAGMDHVRALVQRYAQVGKALRAGVDETDEAGDADTADLLTGQSRAIDKAVWMLEAHLAPDTTA